MRTFRATTALGVLILLGASLVASAPTDTTAPAAPFKLRYFSTALKEAIEKGDLEAVKRCLAGGADINAFDGIGMTLLHHAACHGQKEIVQYLLDRGADVNAFVPKYDRPINLAARNGHTEVARLLAARGAADLDAPSAVAANNVERLRQLVKEDPKLLEKTWYTWVWSEEHTLLHHAAHHGSVESIAALVALGADPKAQDSDGFKPLMIAAAAGHVDAVRELLKHDDRIDLASKYGWTPLNLAASHGREAVVEFLLQRGAEYDIFTAVARGDVARVKALVREDKTLLKAEAGVESPLVWAAGHNKPEVLKWLLDQGADINFHNDWDGSVLSVAVWKGHTEIVKILLDRGANIELGAGKDAYGTPLHRACWQGNKELAALLLDHGAKLESSDKTYPNETPLCFAVKKGQTDLVRFLLDRGANPNGGRSPLAVAAEEGRTEIAQLLLDRGAEVGKAIHRAADKGYLDLVQLLLKYKIDRSLRDYESRTPLHLAAQCREGDERLDQYFKIVDLLLEHGYSLEDSCSGGRQVIHLAHHAMLEHLLKRGADINARTTSNGVTLLHLACSPHKDVELVRFLLEHGADVNAADNEGAMPIHFLLQESDERSKAIAALLREHGAALDVFAQAQLGQTEKVLAMLDENPDLVRAKGESGQNLLHIAAGRGDLELVKMLLSRGADLELKDRLAGWTPLHCAACNGHGAVVEHLIGRGAKVEVPGSYNQGILHTAVYQGHAEVVRLLLAAGADVEATTDWKCLPLGDAARKGNVEIVRMLLDAGAQINRADKGSTALDEAVSRGHEAVVLLLLERGADLNASRNTYSSALHEAASRRSVRMIHILLDAGADVNRLNEFGATALDWALRCGRTDAVKALREAGGMQGHELFGPERMAPLIRQLGDDSYQVREAAEAALRGIAPRIARTLRDALRKTDDPERQVRLRRILASLPPDPSDSR